MSSKSSPALTKCLLAFKVLYVLTNMLFYLCVLCILDLMLIKFDLKT